MYARSVSFRLKPDMQSEYTRTFENQVLPLLRKQKGYKEALTFCNPNSVETVAISLWAQKSDADAYNTHGYPEVVKALTPFIDGTPQVQTFETVITTIHRLSVAA